MGNKTRQLTAEVIGAVIGAGFASGREIAVFFTRFGGWSWAAVAMAVGTVGLTAWALLSRTKPGTAITCLCMGHGRLSMVWRGAFMALMTVTGGAMLAGAGEIVAMCLPVTGALWIGGGVTLVLAALLCEHCFTVMPLVGRGLIGCMLLMMFMGLMLPSYTAKLVNTPDNTLLFGGNALLHGLCYGGFNMALAAPLIWEAGSMMGNRERCRSVVGITVVLGVLLGAGNLLLQKHALLQSEAMPMIRLLNAFGKPGFYLGCVAMYLAVFTTLLASMRGLSNLCQRTGVKSRILQCVGVALVALLGFGGVVEKLYPVLGGGCFCLLVYVTCIQKT